MFAIISDIHSNIEALTTVLKDIDERGISTIYCLGDVVGYGANPKECLDLVIEKTKNCVQGNHDYYTGCNESMDLFTPMARRSIYWTRKQLSSANRKYLRELPLVRDIEDFTIVHSSLTNPSRWNYIFKSNLIFIQEIRINTYLILKDMTAN